MRRKQTRKNESIEVDFYVNAAGEGLGLNSNTWPQRKPRVFYKQTNNGQFVLKPPKNVAKLEGFEGKKTSIRRPGRTLSIAKEQWEHYQDLFDVDGNYIGQNKLKANKKGGRSL